MIRPIDIRLNAAHPDYPLAEAVTFTGSPSTVLVRGVPPNCGRWAITAVSVAATFPDGSTSTRAAVQSANGVWVATLPATATSGRTANGLRVLADGIDENGEAVTGYVLGIADFAVASLDVTPAPQPGETSYQMLYFDATPATPRKGDVTRIDGDLKFYNGEAWLPFTDLSDYYTADQVDEAIDKLAAYYITYDAAGAAFPTRADLLNAQTYYSGGVARVPTRNDYAVVLADELHGGAEYRYIYAVADGETVGQWEAQYPIETNDYTVLSNKPQINGNTLTGNKTSAALGLVNASGGIANQLRLLIAATMGSSAGVYSVRVKYDEATFRDMATLQIVKQPEGPATSEVIVATINLPATSGTLALTADLRYNLNPITIASSGAATATLADLSTNIIVAAADVTSITFTFPPRQTGKMRDFFIRLVIQGTTVPTLYFNEPDGGGAVAFDADDDAWADIEPGVNIMMFSDTAE
ncbi:MAG: hypothetical protein J6V72_05205 [Kiritimatiellae bacterium]|nr:hypothetical protein [Kiritimatiellia bacterium]